MERRFEEPLDCDFGTNPGKHVFHTLEEVEHWAGQEQSTWADLPTHGLSGTLARIAKKQQNIGESVAQAAKQYFEANEANKISKRSELKALIANFRNWEVVHSSTAFGASLVRFWRDNPVEAAAALWAHHQMKLEQEHPQSRPPTTNSPPFNEMPVSTIAGIAKAVLGSGKLTPDVETHTRALEQLRSKLETANSEWHAAKEAAASEYQTDRERRQTAFDQQLAKQQEEAANFIKESSKSVQEVERLYKEQIGLEAPVQYWTEKQSAHDRSVRIWGAVLIVIAVAPFLAIFWFGRSAYAEFQLIRTTLSTGSVALLLVLPVLYLALGRMIGRLFFSQLALREDAAERVAMTKTFLALRQVGKTLDAEASKLAFAAIFRPQAVQSDPETTLGIQDALSKLALPR